jgi:hypothetical protein
LHLQARIPGAIHHQFQAGETRSVADENPGVLVSRVDPNGWLGQDLPSHGHSCGENFTTRLPGLDLICRGLRRTGKDDQEALARGTLIYDALYSELSADEQAAV